MPFLPPNQQCQSTEGISNINYFCNSGTCITWLNTVIWEPTTSHWMKQSTWPRTVLCGGWCLHMALRTPSGACQKRRRKGTVQYYTMTRLHTHTHTHTHIRLTALCPGLPRSAGTRKVNQPGFYWSKRQWVAVASAGPYASLHLTPDR